MSETLTKAKKTPEQVSAQINRIARKLADRAGTEQIVTTNEAGEKNFALVSTSGTDLGRAGDTLVRVNISAREGVPPSGESMVHPGLLTYEARPRPMEQYEMVSDAAVVLNRIRNKI